MRISSYPLDHSLGSGLGLTESPVDEGKTNFYDQTARRMAEFLEL